MGRDTDPHETESDDTDAHDVYGTFAADYAATNHENPARAAYEWPEVDALLPALDGLRVLDAGCGSGNFTALLAERGADVVGVDASEEMVSVARGGHGDDAEFRRADLRERLPFDDATFDLVVSQLTLEHIEGWHAPVREFHRVLIDGGRFVLSCDHPFTTYFVIDTEPDDVGSADANAADYYEVERYERVWGDGEDAVRMPCYRRSLRETLVALFDAGFVVEDLREPRPPEAERDGPLGYFAEQTPRFLALGARAEG